MQQQSVMDQQRHQIEILVLTFCLPPLLLLLFTWSLLLGNSMVVNHVFCNPVWMLVGPERRRSVRQIQEKESNGFQMNFQGMEKNLKAKREEKIHTSHEGRLKRGVRCRQLWCYGIRINYKNHIRYLKKSLQQIQTPHDSTALTRPGFNLQVVDMW